MSQIAASSLSGLQPVQPGQIISANLINLLIASHVELERRLRAIENRPPDKLPDKNPDLGGPRPIDTGVLVPGKDFIRDHPELIGPVIDHAQIMDTDDGRFAVISGRNLHEVDKVTIGKAVLDTSKAEVTETGMRIPLRDQPEAVQSIKASDAAMMSVSGREGAAAKTVLFGQLERVGRTK